MRSGNFIVVCAILAGAGSAGAQVSPLYLGDWTSGQTWVVQGGVVIDSFNRAGPSDGPGMAIGTTIKFIGQEGGQTGREYALDGTLLGGTYTNPSFEDLYDGTTDGGGRNWAIAHNDFDDPQFTVVVGDQDWGGLAPAFTPTRRSSGITYDPVNDSLWVTNTEGFGTFVQQYKTDGTFVSEFPIAIPGAYAIAYDSADDSLWVIESFGSPIIHQFDKNGTNLQNLTIGGISNQVLGAEFSQRIPGPGAAGLLGLAGIVAGRRRK
jgi:hypothetical protein